MLHLCKSIQFGVSLGYVILTAYLWPDSAWLKPVLGCLVLMALALSDFEYFKADFLQSWHCKLTLQSVSCCPTALK